MDAVNILLTLLVDVKAVNTKHILVLSEMYLEEIPCIRHSI